MRPLDHKGRFFSVKGPLNIERSPQGQPVIIQAGGSAPGQELSARSADLVFSVVNGDKASAKAAYDSLKQRVVKHGRAPDELPILPGVMPIIGETDEQAKEQLARLQSWLTPTNALALVSQRIGLRHLRLSARRPGAGVSRQDRARPGVLEGAARHGAPREDDACATSTTSPPPRAAIG